MNKTAGFLPYKEIDGEHFLYLQMRTQDAPHNPGMYGLFGGSCERGESAEDALVREIQEELSITIEPAQCRYFGEFEEYVSVVSLFGKEVDEDFESLVNVQEGEYGAFVSEHDIVNNPLIRGKHQEIFLRVIKLLKCAS
ncbi:MAG: NUDIX domain-containing protein [Patescibacteria group bacterium UBA2163]